MDLAEKQIPTTESHQENQHQAPYKTALIPDKIRLNGPLSTARQKRLYLSYLALYIVGCLLYFFSSSPALHTFGAGLILPGGGFIAILPAGDLWMQLSHVAYLAASIIAFVVALFAWILTGNMLAPIAVWLGAAALAPTMGHLHIFGTPSIVLTTLPLASAVAWTLWRRSKLQKAQTKKEQRNAYLAQSAGGIATPVVSETGLPVVEELSEEDIAQMRYLLDRSLQPVSDFGGFDIIDQFQTASLRYQIANMSYALSLANYCRMPALRGYLAQAQVNLIEKMKEPIVWRYWRLENFWGNLRFDGDPMAPQTDDNVMYSGWYAGMIAMYQSTTGDRRYNTPGSITLKTPGGKAYRYDYPTVVENVYNSMDRSAFCLIPCEPNFIYPMCNNYGSMAIKTEDRLNKTTRWDKLSDRYTEKLDTEFTQVDGTLDIVRSTRIGFAAPAAGFGAEMYSALFLHPVSPGIARRCWEIVRKELLAADQLSDAFVQLDQFDLGNYRRAATSYAPMAACAVEMGDEALAKRLLQEYDQRNPATLDGGVFHRKSASTSIHTLECCARVGRVNGLKDCIEKGMPDEWLNGPILEKVAYPELLVAKAVSDGSNLEAVFYPGQDAGTFTITVGQLVPQGHYQCQGASSAQIKADDRGRVQLAVTVAGRSPLLIQAVA